MDWSTLGSGAGFALIFLGFVFSIIPILPGSPLVFAGIFTYAASRNYETPSTAWLVILGVIAVVAWASEWLMSTMMARRTGATWKTIVGAMIGGLVGAAVLSLPVPIIGTLIGAALGTALGAFILEMLVRQQVGPALKTSGAYLAGCFVSRIVEITWCLIMLGIFVWRIS